MAGTISHLCRLELEDCILARQNLMLGYGGLDLGGMVAWTWTRRSLVSLCLSVGGTRSEEGSLHLVFCCAVVPMSGLITYHKYFLNLFAEISKIKLFVIYCICLFGNELFGRFLK
jgi:hypothetical protein